MNENDRTRLGLMLADPAFFAALLHHMSGGRVVFELPRTEPQPEAVPDPEPKRGPRAHGQDWAGQTHAQRRRALRGKGRSGGKGPARC